MNSKPQIVLTSQDLERLETLLESLPSNAFPGKEELRAELDRAEIVEPNQIPPTVVTMNSTVRFRINSSGEDFCLTLVYPKDVDGSGERISILAPVGSALLGLSTGDEIEWPRPGGGTIKVRIVEVVYQPEREGKFYR
ncbi:nucleoside diphosphate kinase regulator [Nitrosovibrio tenuis]|uniref:GreA/GreB family elongation factor n=1 Tax=Nitrosovibrio tenuis TaxID=1233 RepID=A0A1H7KIZ5_9PROT|nr:nucleoside diphosphate kinase regulator [Nitrosovibrio tenuis]SEK86486.1 GreA/GreB family elongation factor [Nitrosovibrio tenuis]